MLDQNQQENIKKFIKQALGVRWLDQGRGLDGWDCWGLIMVAYYQCFNLTLPDLAGVSALEFTQVNNIFSTCRLGFPEIALGREQPADVAIFRRGRWECHAGLVVARGHLLHVERATDTCVEPFYRAPLRSRLVMPAMSRRLPLGLSA